MKAFLLIWFIVISAIFGGYVLRELWGWFIIPTLNLPILTVGSSRGIALIFILLTRADISKSIMENGDEEDYGGYSLISPFTHPLFVLIVGWILKL